MPKLTNETEKPSKTREDKNSQAYKVTCLDHKFLKGRGLRHWDDSKTERLRESIGPHYFTQYCLRRTALIVSKLIGRLTIVESSVLEPTEIRKRLKQIHKKGLVLIDAIDAADDGSIWATLDDANNRELASQLTNGSDAREDGDLVEGGKPNRTRSFRKKNEVRQSVSNLLSLIETLISSPLPPGAPQPIGLQEAVRDLREVFIKVTKTKPRRSVSTIDGSVNATPLMRFLLVALSDVQGSMNETKIDGILRQLPPPT